jgi:uncharacterized protein (TIGR02246 family)
MKKVSLIIVLVLYSVVGFTQQNTKYDFSKQIDEQLWKSFVEAYSSRNTKRYLALHTDDVVRITKGGIRKGKEFRESIRESFAKKNQPKRTIEFKHEHRIHEQEIAYEIGYFKITYFQNEKEETYFGRFSVLLKKENGRWKIAQDWDVNQINGEPITEKDYEKLRSAIIRS